MSGPTVELAHHGDTLLGECPLWSVSEQVLYWIDIDQRRIHRLDPTTGIDEFRTTPGRPGSIALTSTPGRLLLCSEHEAVWFDWPSGIATPWLAIEEPGLNRFNDGRVDPAGHMVSGTMWPDTEALRRSGAIHRIHADGSTDTILSEVGIPNGTAFDAERGLMYFADTPTRIVLVADYDADTGQRSNVREFFNYGNLPGKPDGACLDAEGCYWSAAVYGWALLRITPNGVLDRTLELPVPKPSMPAFGGTNLSTLYITTIGDAGSTPSEPGRDGFTPGDLLSVDVGIQGRPEPVFGAP
jgi:L-arabinonolactonase